MKKLLILFVATFMSTGIFAQISTTKYPVVVWDGGLREMFSAYRFDKVSEDRFVPCGDNIPFVFEWRQLQDGRKAVYLGDKNGDMLFDGQPIAVCDPNAETFSECEPLIVFTDKESKKHTMITRVVLATKGDCARGYDNMNPEKCLHGEQITIDSNLLFQRELGMTMEEFDNLSKEKRAKIIKAFIDKYERR